MIYNPRLQRPRRKIPREKRSIPQRGFGDDRGRYFRCWYCGFIVDDERDALGDEDSRSGVNHGDFSLPAGENKHSGDPLSVTSMLGGLGHVVVSVQLDIYGNPMTVLHNHINVAGSGCPFCHTLNWR